MTPRSDRAVLRELIREELHAHDDHRWVVQAENLVALCALERRLRDLEMGMLWSGGVLILLAIALGWWMSM